uniref:CDGSH iron-sulfur domain-containing protein 2 n=1 Tax=Rhinolophus ferrumequinum TaxID=59479 RepID=A0A671DR37_RHIFE
MCPFLEPQHCETQTINQSFGSEKLNTETSRGRNTRIRLACFDLPVVKYGRGWFCSLVFSSGKVSEWLRLLPFLGVLALLGYLAVRPFLPKKKQQKDSLINLKIQKENPKVVNEINIEDLCLTKAAYCRCWRSKTVPACDGSHNKHNELTGDNVGPLILKKKEV